MDGFPHRQSAEVDVRIGDRIDRVTLEVPGGKKNKSHGWTWVLDYLRGYFAGAKSA
jgi:hypothetical protein